MNHTTLWLGEYQCTRCGRLFYIDPVERHPLDLDFGCPYGCDDNGTHVRDIKADIEHLADGGQ